MGRRDFATMKRREGMCRRSHLLAGTTAIALALAAPVQAADPRYPDWPCAQAKVPELSVVAVWAGPPIDDAEKTWEKDQDVKDLVLRLAPRRLPIKEAQKLIADFIVGSAQEREAKGTLLFAGLFERLNRERTEVMNGIDRFGRRQKELAEKIRSDISELHKLQDVADPDEAKLKELGNQVEWSTRIFEDRRKSVRYVCEVPALIEQRLYALSRTVQQAME
jgi:hypothetical protein